MLLALLLAVQATPAPIIRPGRIADVEVVSAPSFAPKRFIYLYLLPQRDPPGGAMRGVWRARADWGEGSEEMTDTTSDKCPAFADVMRSFDDLPPPKVLGWSSFGARPPPPVADGVTHTVRSGAVQGDGPVTMTVSGNAGATADWAERLWQALERCTGRKARVLP